MAIFRGTVDQIENTANKVTSITADSTNTQYPGAKAVYDLAGALANNTAGTHNSIFRGKYLGDSVTAAQWAAIQAGTFEDLWIGDYWTIGGVNYRIAAFDYYLADYAGGDSTFATKHHVTIVPDTCPDGQYWAMDSSGTTVNGYASSEVKTTNLAGTVTIIENAFTADHVMQHQVMLCNKATAEGVPSSYTWKNTKVDLMSEVMVFGHNVLAKPAASYEHMYQNGNCLTQLPLFALAPSFINGYDIYANQEIYGYWLRDVVDANCFAYVGTDDGVAYYLDAGTDNLFGFRPSFNIC